MVPWGLVPRLNPPPPLFPPTPSFGPSKPQKKKCQRPGLCPPGAPSPRHRASGRRGRCSGAPGAPPKAYVRHWAGGVSGRRLGNGKMVDSIPVGYYKSTKRVLKKGTNRGKNLCEIQKKRKSKPSSRVLWLSSIRPPNWNPRGSRSSWQSGKWTLVI